MHASKIFLVCAPTFVGALILGGGTRPGFAGDAVLQIASLPLLMYALYKLIDARQGVAARNSNWDLVFCLFLVALPLIQLVPLPPGMRALLPGKALIDETYALLGQDAPSWPISMVPHVTWLALLSLVPPLAIFLGTLLLGYRERRYLCLIFLVFAMFSVFLGLLQLAGGPNSALRPFQFTNPTEAVGLFANRNHYSALLYCATVFAACWVIEAAVRAHDDVSGGQQRWFETTSILFLAGALTVFACLVIAQAMARSRAGLMLTAAALFGTLGLILTDRRAFVSQGGTTRLVFATAAFAIVFSLQFALYRVLERFSFDAMEDTRVVISRKTFEAAIAYLPFGSGMGTFVPVFALFERPEDLVHFYANHAHNDVFEALLEAGVPALVMMAVFAIWLARRSYAVWAGPMPHDASDLDLGLMKSSTLALAFLALHSFADYPLRTAAMMSVAALLCAFLVPPLAGERTTGEGVGHAAGAKIAGQMRAASTMAHRQPQHPHQGVRPAGKAPIGGPDATPGLAVPIAPDRTSQARERWDGASEWPEEWRQAGSSGEPQDGPAAGETEPGRTGGRDGKR